MTTTIDPTRSVASATDELSVPGARVVIDNVSRYYGRKPAVDEVSLTIEPGEFVTLLGASGSGKTTLLRIIAGFNDASSGSITIDGSDISRVPVHRRNIGMVFQNYALFPHLTVARNVAYPLARRGVPRRERRSLIDAALGAVELTGFERRLPRELSGGQQQRVALARAIVARPRLLLMDEPLGALDRRLREALQLQIRQLSHELGLTVINVTHDQEEALTMSDRIAMLAGGRVMQFGTPRELYAEPRNEVVARFLGESNTFSAPVDDTGSCLQLTSSRVLTPHGRALAPGETATVFVRPHNMRVAPGEDPIDPESCFVRGRISDLVYAGDSVKVLVDGEHGEELVIRATTPTEAFIERGATVSAQWRRADSLLLG
jgi:putative spermidine/putrescine transport system ATP-binding protein